VTIPEPDMPLKPAARTIWDRLVKRFADEGRLGSIDRDALAVYSRTLALYQELQDAVDGTGVLVSGRDGALVKSPLLPALGATRDSLLRLGAAIPLVDRAAAAESAKFDRLMASFEEADV
jgi:P27 family predicted phage terminase small subunit